ncbi:hypothetical protein WOB59_00485 [Methylocystis sp. IM4]|uniref:hypothetical protein n=1 Tax=Methylocystis sp. IM4 TaxID=3136560 RepID=UPI00311A14CF
MADYLTPTVVQPMIPETDISPLERLLLENIFSVERYGEDLYFFAEEGPSTFPRLNRSRLEAALAASKDRSSSIVEDIASQLSKAQPNDTEVELDMSAVSWEFLFQGIVRRSPTLSYVTVVSSFTCTKMRPDGFGGMAVLITKDAVLGKSTQDIIEDFFVETGLDQREDGAPAQKGADHA